MRRVVFALGVMLVPWMAAALEVEDRRRFGPEDAETELKVLSTADISVFAPVIDGFLAEVPDVAVDYVEASSGQVMQALIDAGEPFDVAISSAMDLQTKLANDGYTRAHSSAVTQDIPDWARWRDDLFAFTREPAVIVLSHAAFQGIEMPRTRQDLIAILRQYPDRFRGRIGTYDVRVSGLGYLFATQDARTSETFWRLTEIMGFLETRLYCCSSDMIDDVASGRLAVAYNVLGSYAAARPDAAAYQILQPEDYTTMMLRTALIPRTAPSPELAGEFLDHLLAIAWLGKPLEGYAFERLSVEDGPTGAGLRHIRLGPALLVYLDRFKKRSFLAAWASAMLQQ